MSKFSVAAITLLLVTGVFAQTTMYNTITSPVDGSTITSSYEPYDISLSGIASASSQSDLEIVITLDNSGSIGSTNFGYEKQAAAYLISQLVDPADNTKLLADVGIVSFDYYGNTVLSPPSSDATAVNTALNNLAFANGGATNWADAIQETRSVFASNGNSGEEICFFFSDGNPNYQNPWTDDATDAYADGIMFNSFAIGSGVNGTYMDQLGGTSLATGDGHYWHANSFPELQNAVDDALPATGSVALDYVDVFLNGTDIGDATIGAAGTYSMNGVELVYGVNEIKTVAYATDGSFAEDIVNVTLVPESTNVPEPGIFSMLITGMFLMGGTFLKRKKN